MAESLPLRRSVAMGSDNIIEKYCEPCYEVADVMKPTVGYCQNCNEDLCIDCYAGHPRRKLYKDHTLVNKSTKPKTGSQPQTKRQDMSEECLLHHGKALQSFCHGHSEVCCNVCLTIKHQGCLTEDISKLARNIQDSEELKSLNKKLIEINKGLKNVLDKREINEAIIQKNHQDAVNEMKKIRNEFNKLMIETENHIDKVKEEDLQKIQKVSATCDIVTEQINNTTINIGTTKEKGEANMLFIAMKRAESQFKALEETFDNLQKDNTVREYKFKPDGKLEALLQDLNVLGELSFLIPQNITISDKQIKQRSDQMAKRPSLVKDITVKSKKEEPFGFYGCLMLPNNRILITDWQNKTLKLIGTNINKIISSLQLSDWPFGITKVKEDDVAVTVDGPLFKIKFISISKNTLAMGRELSVDGRCRGIAYNEKDQTLVVTYVKPGKIEILDMAGTVIKRLDKDSKGNPLFDQPHYVALCPNMTDMYVTDEERETVTSMTMNGDIKAVYKDKTLQKPEGLCVHKSGLVYVVGWKSQSVHQLDPVNSKFKLLLDQTNGLVWPLSVSYCHLEDKMYIGMDTNSVLKVFLIK